RASSDSHTDMLKRISGSSNARIAVASPCSDWSRHTNPGLASAIALMRASSERKPSMTSLSSGARMRAMFPWPSWKRMSGIRRSYRLRSPAARCAPPTRRLLHADCLDVVAVRVREERGVVLRAVVRAHARRSVVLAACGEAALVEGVDAGAARRTERHVRARALRILRGVEPERRLALRAEARARGVARAALEAERLERARVEAHALVEIPDLETDVIVHARPPSCMEVRLERGGE